MDYFDEDEGDEGDISEFSDGDLNKATLNCIDSLSSSKENSKDECTFYDD